MIAADDLIRIIQTEAFEGAEGEPPPEQPRRNGPPTVGEWLRRRDSKKWAQVLHVSKHGGYSVLTSVPLFEGDVIMEYGPGETNICSGGEFFWARWERVEVGDMVQLAIRDAHGQLL